MKTDKEKEKEKCVSCGEETHVPKDLHIDFRDFYIEGVGQLCYDCHKELYNGIIR